MLPQPILDKVRHNSTLSPIYYWSRAPLAATRRRHLSGEALRCRDELRATAATQASIDALGLEVGSLWDEVAALTAAVGDGVSEGGDILDGRNTASHCLSIDEPDLARQAPSTILLGLHPTVLDIVESYLRVPVALSGLHLRKDIGTGQQTGTRIWHRDTEDYRVIRMIVYLTDVTIDDGPFEYLPLEHSDAMPPEIHERGLRAKGDPLFDDEVERLVPRASWAQALGPRGTIALADNARLFHHGRPHRSERLALFYTFTSRSPRYPVLERNTTFDHLLSPRQRRAFFLDTSE